MHHAPARIVLVTELPSEGIVNIIAFTMALKYKCKQMRVSRIVLAYQLCIKCQRRPIHIQHLSTHQEWKTTIIKFARDTQTHNCSSYTLHANRSEKIRWKNWGKCVYTVLCRWMDPFFPFLSHTHSEGIEKRQQQWALSALCVVISPLMKHQNGILHLVYITDSLNIEDNSFGVCLWSFLCRYLCVTHKTEKNLNHICHKICQVIEKLLTFILALRMFCDYGPTTIESAIESSTSADFDQFW